MDRKAKAIWKGDLKHGKGEISSDSGTLKSTPYSFATRFGDTPGLNPEELIAAAHAGCFTMALSAALGKKGYIADSLETSATVSLHPEGEGFKIASSRLILRARVPDIDEKAFNAIAEDAKKNCPVSKVLNADIRLDIDFHSPLHSSSSAH